LANAINLRASDVPELEPRRNPRKLEVRSGPLAGCDARQLGVIGVSSRTFAIRRNERREGAGVTLTLYPFARVSSTVYLMGSGTQAIGELAAYASEKARACTKRLEERFTTRNEAGKTKPFVTQVEVFPLPSPLPALPIRGLRRAGHVAIAPGGAHGRPNFYSEQFGFVLGRVLVILDTAGSPNPFRVATERRLLSLPYSRAKAHKL